MPPETHAVCGWEQLLVHVSEQAAVGLVPEQDRGLGHVDVDAGYRQLLPSTKQVTTVCASWQTVPGAVQIEGMHVQAASPPAEVHVACAPQVAEVVQAVQPFACIVHVCTAAAPGAHCVAPAIHAFVHDPFASTPAPASALAASKGDTSPPASAAPPPP